MKSAIIVAVLFVIGAISGPFVFAQFDKRRSVKSPMKVGVVKIAPVLDAQWKQTLASNNNDSIFRAFQTKARKLQRKLDANKQRHSAELENLKAEYAGTEAKWHDQRRKEIEDAVKELAETHGFHLVYCDAFEVEHWSGVTKVAQFTNHQWAPVFGHQAIDVTDDLIETMKRLENEKKSPGVP